METMAKCGALCIATLLVSSCSSITPLPVRATEPYENTILPSDDVPRFVRKQRDEIFTNGQFRQPERDWKEVGLPSGLEKQVWNAWGPDAKPLWKQISPGYTNVIYDAKVDGGVVTAVLDGFGLVQSKDGGRNWRALSHHLTSPSASIGYFGFDTSPADPNIVAVAGVTIDYSLNGGRSWAPVIDPNFIPFKPMIVKPGKRAKEGALAFGFVRFNADGSRIFTSPGAFGHELRERHGLEPEMGSWLKRKLIYAGDEKVSNFRKIDLGDFAGIRFILPHPTDPDLVYASFADGTIYICRNATSADPAFTELTRPALLDGVQAICMDVSPEDPSTLLLTMMDNSGKRAWDKSKVVLAKVSGDRLECERVKASPDGETLSYVCAKWNPHNPKHVFVGVSWGRTALLVSEDGMKSFQWRDFPKELFPATHITGYASPRTVVFDRKSDQAAVYSVTGFWSTRDEFKHVEELVMTHDYDKQLYGNKGVGFAECGYSVCIRENYTYLATNDHGSWRSNGTDTSRWRKISDNPGMPKLGKYRLAYPMAVSDDEQVVLLVARLKNWTKKDHKLVLSRDKGDTWTDITERLGLGPVVEGGIHKIFFDPTDAKTAWVLANAVGAGQAKLFNTTDGCETFRDTGTTISMNLPYAYDPDHRTLYTAGKGEIKRSTDMGFTWTALAMPFSGHVHGLGVLENGDLVAGDDGRLLVIPYDRIDSTKVEQSMIRLTIGETRTAAACGLRTFKRVLCRGTDIIAFTDHAWNNSNAHRDLGPLLSRDGGKTFQWIVYDLSCCAAPHSLDMRNDKIIVGGRGVHELDLSGLDPQP